MPHAPVERRIFVAVLFLQSMSVEEANVMSLNNRAMRAQHFRLNPSCDVKLQSDRASTP
jgi:hypothetical protein